MREMSMSMLRSNASDSRPAATVSNWLRDKTRSGRSASARNRRNSPGVSGTSRPESSAKLWVSRFKTYLEKQSSGSASCSASTAVIGRLRSQLLRHYTAGRDSPGRRGPEPPSGEVEDPVERDHQRRHSEQPPPVRPDEMPRTRRG